MFARGYGSFGLRVDRIWLLLRRSLPTVRRTAVYLSIVNQGGGARGVNYDLFKLFTGRG